MKWGLICARRARTSASISRLRERSSSASSSCPLTHDATSSAARTRPPVVCGAPTTSAPTRVSSTTSGLTIACVTWQPPSSQTRVRSSRIIVRPVSATWLIVPASWLRWCEPRPSHASSPLVSPSPAAGVPSRARRWRTDRSALADVRPSRSAGLAREALCSARKAARSASPPSDVRRHLHLATQQTLGARRGSRYGSALAGPTTLGAAQVTALLAVDLVAAGTAVERVVPVAEVGTVVAGAAEDRVVAADGVERVVAAPAHHPVLRARATDDRVVAATAEEHRRADAG